MKCRSVLVAMAVVAGAVCVAGAASLTYEGSVPIGENIMPAAIQAFQGKTGVSFTSVTCALGSTGGFKAVMEGKCDVAGVARALTADEKKAKPYYQIIGYDALAVFVHPSNPLTALTKDQLKSIFSGKITNWNEVGGKDAKIVIITARKDLKRATMDEFKTRILDSADFCQTIEMEKPAEFIKRVSEDPAAITFDSFSYRSPSVKVIAINKIDLSPVTIRSGAYLLSKPLILVTRGLPQGDLKKFFSFMISPDGQKIVGQSFIPVR